MNVCLLLYFSDCFTSNYSTACAEKSVLYHTGNNFPKQKFKVGAGRNSTGILFLVELFSSSSYSLIIEGEGLPLHRFCLPPALFL